MLETLYAEKIVVVLREKDPDLVRAKARAVYDGGLRVQEVTWTTPKAAELIKEFSKAGLGIIGAGTILELPDAKKAVAAGAKFLVSPVFTKAVAAYAKSKKIPYLPGCATAQECYTAWKAGCRPIKVFPAPTLGGPEFIRRLLAPMPFLELLPTLIKVEEIPAYLAAGAKAVGIGGAGMPDAETMAREAVKIRG
ncbi:MAG TPA: bifunctional 4-hydroxy-2-oxoglutarate aldolase/2-dehydro-3-deoxy-phosphogluconate aldolase [Planctomycetota bacterium]